MTKNWNGFHDDFPPAYLALTICEEGICSNIGLTIHPALALKCSRICSDNVHYVLPFVKQTDKTAG